MQRFLPLAAALLAALNAVKTVTASSLPQQIPFTLPETSAAASQLPQSHLTTLNDDATANQQLVRLTLPEDRLQASDVIDRLEVIERSARRTRALLRCLTACWL